MSITGYRSYEIERQSLASHSANPAGQHKRSLGHADGSSIRSSGSPGWASHARSPGRRLALPEEQGKRQGIDMTFNQQVPSGHYMSELSLTAPGRRRRAPAFTAPICRQRRPQSGHNLQRVVRTHACTLTSRFAHALADATRQPIGRNTSQAIASIERFKCAMTPSCLRYMVMPCSS